jgi:hypothetical protein
VPSVTTLERTVPWALRIAWIAVAVAGGQAVDGALVAADGAAPAIIEWTGSAIWVVGAVAMSIPAVATLTATRVVVPLGLAAATAAAFGEATTSDVALFGIVAVIAAVLAATGELGRTFVQASAYGHEDRHLLRPPAAYLGVAVVAWSVWAVVIVLTAAAIVDDRWVWGVIGGAVALGGAAFGAPRWHRLSRRWLVLVPAGVVVHDHLVLAETLMVRRQEIGVVGLAPAGTDAADLTGPASGHAIEIRTREPVTALLAASPSAPRGTAIHLTGFLVAPTRPGRFLAAATARRLPVGAVP